MSEKDPLKSIFDRAFAQETIPFDPQGWEQMEAALNAKPKNKLGFLWLFSGIALVAAAVGFSMLNYNMAAMYEPRAEMAVFDPVESVGERTAPLNEPRSAATKTTTSNSPTAKVEITPEATPKPEAANTSTVANASSTKPTKVKSNHSIASQSSKIESNEGSPSGTVNSNHQGGIIMPADDEKDGGTSTRPASDADETASLNPSEAPEVQATPSDGQQGASPIIAGRKDNNLNTMDLLPAYIPEAEHDVVSATTADETSNKPQLDFYLRLGAVKTANTKGLSGFNGLGQTIGLGMNWRAKPHFLLSSEINLYREMVRYELSETNSRYGYSRSDRTLLTTVNELLSAEIPIMAHYRYNRWSVGAGVSAQILLSSRITETLTTSGAADFAPTTEETFDGYAHWSGMATINMNLPVQVTYRLSESYFVGARYRYGFSDLFKPNGVADRKTGFELFMRMNF